MISAPSTYLFPRGEAVNVSDGPSKSQGHPEGLYPLQVLIKPVALRFKYHFDGTRQTNRIDKVDQLAQLLPSLF